jgi:Ca2+-transporting ATPase
VALAVRVPRSSGAPRNRSLGLAVAAAAALQLAGVFVGPLRELLGTSSLTLPELGVCVLLAAVPGLVVRFRSRDRGVDTIRP